MTTAHFEIAQHIDNATRAIPPGWPLASSVAVNPYWGQTTETLAATGARLARVGGIAVTMPNAWYAEKIANGTITDDDLDAALAASPISDKPPSIEALKAALKLPTVSTAALSTVADLAATASGNDWPGILADRFGLWAAGYFDEGQALWAAPHAKGAFTTWRAFASMDLTPEIAGLSGFGAFVSELPGDATACIGMAINELGVPEAALTTYLHQLHTTLSGWSHYGRYRLWQAELVGGTDATMTDLLAIRLMWELALYRQYRPAIIAQWEMVLIQHAEPLAPTPAMVAATIAQEAAERAIQRSLAATLAQEAPIQAKQRPALQAAFCIDVRSEVFRRALESVAPNVQTIGFAGFFGLTAAHRRFGSDVTELRLPVLLNPGVTTCSGGSSDAAADLQSRYTARGKRAWGRFKLAAVSSFAFVEATGPVYLGKLIKDALGLKGKAAKDDPAPRLDPALDAKARIDAGETILRAMSMTDNFARLVLLAGHGANVVNNPHASGLHCGACGGYSGEVNARLLASLLNDPEVRAGLAERGINVPADTLFLGALHDTTTDAVPLYEADHPAASHAPDIAQAKAWLAQAAVLARSERALRLPHAAGATITQRSTDWAEVRPEWALAGCKAFIAAPRQRTTGKSLEGRAFLHDYDWKQDKSFGVLELIMTAPVVVASWISLQYYGSSVSPQAFGGGNKLLHNVTGGVGVLEGNGGVLRPGLPWQSVHDGEKLVHEPLRLSVCIEAPREAMTEVLAKHDLVRALFDNRWLHLFALDETGQMAWRYSGDLAWEPMETVARVPLKAVA